MATSSIPPPATRWWANFASRGDTITTFRLSPASGPASYDSAQAVIAKAPVAHLRRRGARVRRPRHHRHARPAGAAGGQHRAEHADGLRVARIALCRGAGAQRSAPTCWAGRPIPTPNGRSPPPSRGAAIRAGCRCRYRPAVPLGAGLRLAALGAQPEASPNALTCHPVAHRLQAVAGPKKLWRRRFRGASGGRQ